MTTTPAEVLRQARDALAGLIGACKQAKVSLTVGIRDGDPVHPVSADLTWPLATAINALAAIDALPSAPAADIDEAQLARLSEHGAVAWAGVTDDDIRALRDGSAPSGEPAPTRADLIAALQFYAAGNHRITVDESALDTVSGEPNNWLANEAGDMVEDGTIAKQVLAGRLTAEDLADDDDARAPTAPAPLPADWLLRSQVSDLLHLLEFSALRTSTGSDDAQARKVMADLRRTLAAPLLSNGLTLSETAATASVAGLADHVPVGPEAEADTDAKLGMVLLPPIRVDRATHAALQEAAKARGLIVQAIVRERLAPYAAPQAAPVPARNTAADKPKEEAWTVLAILDLFRRSDPGEHQTEKLKLILHGFAAAQTLPAAAAPEPVATILTWHKNGQQHADLMDWRDALASLPDGTHDLYTAAPAVAATVQALTIKQVSDVRDALAGTQYDMYDLYDFAAAIGKACAAAWGVTLATPAAPKGPGHE